MSNARSRAYVFTLNNYTNDELQQLLGRARADVSSTGPGLRFIVVGYEKGTRGTPHLQGYVEFWAGKTHSAAKRYISNRAHVERRRGTSEQAYRYCAKDGNFTTIGTRTLQPNERASRGGDAERERWELARDAAKQGRFDDIPADIFIRAYSSIRAIHRDYLPDVPDATEVCGVWIWGPPGVGKSRYARQQYPGSYTKLCNKWWDGYGSQSTVIMDDVGLSHECLGYHLKIWTDRYSFIAEVKGGAIRARPRTFVITSNYAIESIFGKDPEIARAIRRRCKVIHMDTFPPQ